MMASAAERVSHNTTPLPVLSSNLHHQGRAPHRWEVASVEFANG